LAIDRTVDEIARFLGSVHGADPDPTAVGSRSG